MPESQATAIAPSSQAASLELKTRSGGLARDTWRKLTRNPGAVMGLIGDFRHVGKILLGILVGGVLIVYLVKRRWVSKRVEEIKPERLQQIEHAAIDSVKELKDEIKEKIHLKRD